MTKVISFVRQDTCLVCKADRSIECYDTYNRPINFTRLLDYIEQGKSVNLQSREFSHMICSECGRKFPLSWYERDIPRPLVRTEMLDYMIETYY